MRKFMMILTIAGALAAGAPADSASLGPRDFKYCADLGGALRTEALYQVHVTGDILEKSAPGMEDLRLFGPGGKETPLVIIDEVRPAETIETYRLEVIDYSADASAARITLKLPEKRLPISVLELSTPDRDFKKQARLEGSPDKKIWKPLADEMLYDFSSQVDLRKTKIGFARTDYRYFRLTLTEAKPSAPSNGQQSIRLKYEGLDFSVNNVQKKELRIQGVEGRTSAPRDKTTVYDEKAFAALQATTDKDNNTVVILKAGLPMDKLSFDVSNPYYHRNVDLYSSDTGKEDSYRLVVRQAIYRFPLSSKQHETRSFIEAHSARSAYYKIVIVNRNNPPLDMKGVTISWTRKNLYFIALSSGTPHSLCFGNPALTRPDYDIARFINSGTLEQHAYDKLAASPIRETPGYKAPIPGGQKAVIEKTILRIVVVLLVIGIGFWLYSLMKNLGEKK